MGSQLLFQERLFLNYLYSTQGSFHFKTGAFLIKALQPLHEPPDGGHSKIQNIAIHLHSVTWMAYRESFSYFPTPTLSFLFPYGPTRLCFKLSQIKEKKTNITKQNRSSTETAHFPFVF